jgi:hypothetical protein
MLLQVHMEMVVQEIMAQVVLVVQPQGKMVLVMLKVVVVVQVLEILMVSLVVMVVFQVVEVAVEMPQLLVIV